MGRRVISITFAVFFCLLAARTSLAESIDFQTANASGGGQSGGAQTSQSGSVQTPQGASGATGSQVQTVDFGDVTGTVCDCGEIAPAGEAAAAAKGGFPKFPLLALAVLPGIACCGGSSQPPPTPPNTPETPVPEPLTLATLAAGLSALAGLRSRRRS